MKEKKYFAFISYKSEDVEWAVWLQHELEHYHLPASFNGRTDIRQELRPVFRDIDELSAGNLPKQIYQALENSQNLIVVCSPQAALSKWVNKEIETFISFGRTERIFPFIVGGDSPKEFFPSALLNLPINEERLGGNVNKNGRDAAFVKIVAGMLNLGFDALWNRYEKEKAEAERRLREERDYLLTVQSKYLSEAALTLFREGNTYLARLLALEALPKNLDLPERPYVRDAEIALRTICQHDTVILEGHAGVVCAANYSNDGKYIVSASTDRTVCIWDAFTGKLRVTLNGHENTVLYAVFSPDDRFVASASKDKTIRIWNSETGALLHVLKGHSESVNFVAFNPQGNIIASASDDNSVILWDIKTGTRIRTLEEDKYDIYGYREDISVAHVELVSFSPDGTLLLGSLNGGTMRLWDWQSGKLLRTWVSGRYTTLCKNGEFMISVREDDFTRENHIVISNIETGEQYLQFEGPKGYINSLFMSPDSQYVVSASGLMQSHYERSMKVWDNSGKLIQTFENSLPILYANFSPDSKYIAVTSVDNTIRIIELESNHSSKLLFKQEQIVFNFTFSLCGNYIALVSSDVKLLNLKTNSVLATFSNDSYSLRKPIAFSSDSKYFATASSDYTIIIWDIQKGTTLHILKGPTRSVESLKFSPDGSLILSAAPSYPEIIVWDVKSGKELYKTLEAHITYQMDVHCVTFSPDGTLIVMAGRKNISIWSLQIKSRILSKLISLEHLRNIRSRGRVVISPDGKQIASYDWNLHIIRIWSIETGELLRELVGHTDGVNCVCYSQDGERLASASTDKTIRLWDVCSGALVQTFRGHTSMVSRVKFSLDGDYIISTSPDKTIRVWYCPPLQKLINVTSMRFMNRPLTQEECEKYFIKKV